MAHLTPLQVRPPVTFGFSKTYCGSSRSTKSKWRTGANTATVSTASATAPASASQARDERRSPLPPSVFALWSFTSASVLRVWTV